MIEKEKLKIYAQKLLFEMKEEEYDTLQKEFEIILDQLSLIENIPGISKVEPMVFPIVNDGIKLRKDKAKNEIDVDQVLENADHVYQNQVRVPKVVE
ncbi:MAG: hypothetical protein WDA12_03945 [Bacilli bacterium]